MGPLLATLLLLCTSQSPTAATSQAPAPPAAGAIWEQFPAFLWRADRTSDASLELARALGGALVLGAAERPGDLPFLVFNAAGRDALHLDEQTPGVPERRERWIATRDDALLTRRPCLTDPATRAELFATLDASLAARGGDPGLGLSLGDEVSLTPNGSPSDVCLSPTCRAAWTVFLASRAELDDKDRERYADPASGSTDAARRALSDGDSRALEAWLLRRDFHAQVLSELLAELAAHVRTARPNVPVGLLGAIDRTTFGGIDLDAVLPELDWIECYPVSQAREQMFTARRGGVRALQTVFPTERAPHRAAWHTFDHWLRGGDGVVVWSDRELLGAPVARARIERALGDLRRLAREVGTLSVRPTGVALVHSPRSNALAWLREALLDGPTWPNRLQGSQERDGEREASLRSWLLLLEDLALMPGALPLSDVDAGTAQRFPVLVLHRVSVLADADLQRLEAFLAGGGTLVVDGQLGWIDERGRPREASAREALDRLAPDRVLDAPRVATGYAELRRRSPATATTSRAAWGATLAQAGVRRAPFRLASAEPDIPWLCSWTDPDPRGGRVCVALPNTPSTALCDRLVRVEVAEGSRVEWLHPAAPGPEGRITLPAGDAAVFRLVPGR